MELEEKSLKVKTGMSSEKEIDTEIVNSGINFGRELEDSKNWCFELEERSQKATERCALLELGIEKKKNELALLEGKFRTLEDEKLAIEDELRILKKRNDELEERITRIENENKVCKEAERGIGRVVDLTGENDEKNMVLQLMIENEVLNCEKKKAESELEVWKVKCKQLDSCLSGMEEIWISRGLECKPTGMMKGDLRSPEVITKKMSEVQSLKDGWDVATSSTHLHMENRKDDDNVIIHGAVGAETTCNSPAQGTPDFHTSAIPPINARGRKKSNLFETELEYGNQVKMHLAFGEEGSPNKKIAPSTPGNAKPASMGVIAISDSDDEIDAAHFHMPSVAIRRNKMACLSTNRESGGTMGNSHCLTSKSNLKRTLEYHIDDEAMGGSKNKFLFISTPKRKRAANIVASDSESDDDDVPICMLERKHIRELESDSYLNNCPVNSSSFENGVGDTVTKRSPVALWNCKVKDGPESSSVNRVNTRKTKHYVGISTDENLEDDPMEDESDSEGESLGGFIVESSDISEGSVCSSDVSDHSDTSGEPENVSDSDIGGVSGDSENVADVNVDFNEVLSRIRRNRNQKSTWEFEADMLADLGKDPELCMKAVCALYRQQTTDEKSSKGTIYHNKRGFSQCDASRGTLLAEFLTDGDPQGDLKKSVKELQEYDPKGLEQCRRLAAHYSKQLFTIYKNEEDPFFIPS